MTRRMIVLLAAISLLAGTLPAAGQLVTQDGSDFLGGSFSYTNNRSFDTEISVFVQLHEPSVAEFVADRARTQGTDPSAAQQASQRDRISVEQAQARSALAPFITDEISTFRAGANGIRVVTTVGELAAIRALPQVKSIAFIEEYHRLHETSVPSMGAPSVWAGVPGLTGEGMTIAIIDSGIDQYHANFDGTGDPGDYAAGDPTNLDDGSFPNNKIIGGWDFVGDDYTGGLSGAVPDPNPVDCGGHGTHVAGTAAGMGVLADGQTYRGPYDETTFDNEWRVAPGVAPEALLYALKVFGCTGSTSFVGEAIEWALDPNGDGILDDSVDVINMSLGSLFGNYENNLSAILTQAAVNLGIVVVASAGNSGDIPYITGAPAVAPGAISVAASVDPGAAYPAILVNSPEGIAGAYEATEGQFGLPLALSGEVTRDAVLADDGTANPNLGCEPLVGEEDKYLDKIVLVQRGVCAFVVKYANAVDAGAAGVVVYNNTTGIINMGGVYENPPAPAVSISQANGEMIVAAMAGGPVNITMSPDAFLPRPDLADSMADFSSKGPGRGGSTFKPEIAAPGFLIRSADVGTGTLGTLLSGTSMAAPHIAGMAALLRQQYPNFGVDAIKSMILNSAGPTDPVYATSRSGNGIARVDVAAANRAFTTPAAISFGHVNPLAPTVLTQQVSVTRFAGTAVSYTVNVDDLASMPGVTITAPSSVNVLGFGTTSFTVTMTLDPSAMPGDTAIQSFAEAYGLIKLTAPGEELTVGYLAVADPAATVSAVDTEDGLTLVNDGPAVGHVDVSSLVRTGDDFGLGVAAFGASILSATERVFAVAMDEGWETPNLHEVEIWFDVNQNGIPDWLLLTGDLGRLQGLATDGNFVTAWINVATSSGQIQYFGHVDYNDRVMSLPISSAALAGEVDYELIVWDAQLGIPLGYQVGAIDFDSLVPTLFGTLPADAEFVICTYGDTDTLILLRNNVLADQYQVNMAGQGCPVDDADEGVGAFDPTTGQWHLLHGEDDVDTFFFGAPGDVPLMGDWNGNGVDTVGVYRPSNGWVYLRNTNTSGEADVSFWLGDMGDTPVAGDFNGDGFDTVSMYDMTTGEVFLYNALGDGDEAPDLANHYWFGVPGDKPFSGDFNGDGTDTFGLHRESSGIVYFTNGHETAVADDEFYFGIPGDRLIAGDWGIVDGIDTPAVFRPSNTTWYFRHTNTQGVADHEFVWGESHWLPVAGKFGLEEGTE